MLVYIRYFTFMNRPTWDDTWISMCYEMANRSKDRSTRVGCVIVGPNNIPRALGYNGIPRKCKDNVENRHKRPQKYFYFEHGERNAIFNAAREGRALEGCRIYIPAPPCVDCSRAIIQSGLTEVICDSLFVPKRWKEACDAGIEMLLEAGILIRQPNSDKPVTSWVYKEGDGWGGTRSRGLSPS